MESQRSRHGKSSAMEHTFVKRDPLKEHDFVINLQENPLVPKGLTAAQTHEALTPYRDAVEEHMQELLPAGALRFEQISIMRCLVCITVVAEEGVVISGLDLEDSVRNLLLKTRSQLYRIVTREVAETAVN